MELHTANRGNPKSKRFSFEINRNDRRKPLWNVTRSLYIIWKKLLSQHCNFVNTIHRGKERNSFSGKHRIPGGYLNSTFKAHATTQAWANLNNTVPSGIEMLHISNGFCIRCMCSTWNKDAISWLDDQVICTVTKGEFILTCMAKGKGAAHITVNAFYLDCIAFA